MGTGLFDIRGKTAVVTGGSRGIGSFIARGFVEAGARVFICSRHADACDRKAAELSEVGECYSIPCDLTEFSAIRRLADELGNRTGKVDILVNNAGAQWGEALESFPEKGWDKVVDLNMKSVFFLTQNLLPLLKRAASKDDPARIINIGSVAAFTVSSLDNYSYAASKAGMHHMSRVMALSLAGANINVNVIAPGAFETKMISFALENRAVLEAQIPRGHVGQRDDIAGVAIFLASRAGAFVTGAVLPVDGGMSLRES